jgi:MurNAc alpha-1-phosphate uridylyltransferase
MVLSAGFGTRMRPLTDTLPKPLIEVRGRSLLDRILDHLERGGVETVVVNLHHLGEKIEDHLSARPTPSIIFSREQEILDTGGGVKRALPELGDEPFLVINGDVFWLDGLEPALSRLARAWRDEDMDALLLMQPIVSAVGYDGQAGDFSMAADGSLRRRREHEIAPFLFAGVQILHPRLFAGAPEGPFSLNRLFDAAQEAGRLWGLRHDGLWFHVGTPAALREVEEVLHDLAIKATGR